MTYIDTSMNVFVDASDGYVPGISTSRATTEVFFWGGRRGSGKSYGSGKFVEELLFNGCQVIVVDVVGTWWGLRASKDGTPNGGFPIPVIGGQHGDIGVVAEGGAVVAQMLAATSSSAVLDLSELRKGARQRFLTDWAEEFFHLKKSNQSPVHVVLEEAHTLIPQRTIKGQERMLGAFEDLVRLGRNYGIGVSMLDQRPQSVHKDMLNQAEVMLAFQFTGAQERDAIRRWAEAKEQPGVKAALADLARLPRGHCILWSPEWLKRCELVRVDQKRTLDTSSTPDAARAHPSKVMRPIDLRALEAAMTAAAGGKLASKIERGVNIHASDSTKVTQFEQLTESLRRDNAALEKEIVMLRQRLVDSDLRVRELVTKLNVGVGSLRTLADEMETSYFAATPPPAPDMRPEASNCGDGDAAPPVSFFRRAGAEIAGFLASVVDDAATNGPPDPKLSPLHRRLLTAIAVHGPVTQKRALLLADRARSGDTDKAFAFLREQAYVSTTDDALVASDQGLKALGTLELLGPPRLPSHDKLFLSVIEQFGPITQKMTLLRAGYARSGDTDMRFASLQRRELVATDKDGALVVTPFGKQVLTMHGGYATHPKGRRFYETFVSGGHMKLTAVEIRLLETLWKAGVAMSQKDLLAAANRARSGDTDTAFARLVKLGLFVRDDKGHLKTAAFLRD